MGVPGKDAFSRYVMELDVPILDAMIDIEAVARGGVSAVTDMLEHQKRAFAVLRGREEPLEVGRWFQANATAKRAWAALFRHKEATQPTVAEQAERLFVSCYRIRTADDFTAAKQWLRTDQTCEAYLAKHNTEAARLERLTRRLKSLANHRPYGVACDVARAFSGYFYEEAFRRYSAPPRKVRTAADELLRAWRCLNDAEKWTVAGVNHRYLKMPKTTLELLELSAGGGAELAIKKLDATARERALAFELWSTARRTFRANKTTAIYNFLQFEGVQNAPDARSVERWVADWRKRGVSPAPSQRDA